MKKLAILWLFVLVFWAALSVFSADVRVTVSTPNMKPITNSLLLTNIVAPSVANGGVAIPVNLTAIPVPTATNSVATFSNLVEGSYRITVKGMPGIQWTIAVPDTNGTVDATSIISTGTNSTSNALYAWSVAASDARYALKGEVSSDALTNGYAEAALKAPSFGNGSQTLPHVAALIVHTNGTTFDSSVGIATSNNTLRVVSALTDTLGEIEAATFRGNSLVVTGSPASIVLQSRSEGSPVVSSITLDDQGDTTITAGSLNFSGDLYGGGTVYALGFSGSGSGLTALPAAEVTGNLTAVSNVIASGTFIGNGSGLTNLSPNFTTTNGQLLLESQAVAPNVVMGSSSNRVIGGTGAAVILGGGSLTYPNIVTGDDSRYGGVFGGYDNLVNGIACAIVGAQHSTNFGTHNLISGGSYGITASNADYATIIGGTYNSLLGDSDGASAVGCTGGVATNATYGVLLGGYSNYLGAPFTLAAGNRASATAYGAMIFNSDSGASTNSTTNSIMLSALGGVRLHVRGGVSGLSFSGNNTFPIKLTPDTDATANMNFDIGAPHSAASGSSPLVNFFSATTSSGSPAVRVHRAVGSSSINTSLGGNGDSYLNVLAGNVGIGTNAPQSKLHVAGTITAPNFVATGIGQFTKSNSLPTAATVYNTIGGAGFVLVSYTNAVLAIKVDAATNATYTVTGW